MKIINNRKHRIALFLVTVMLLVITSACSGKGTESDADKTPDPQYNVSIVVECDDNIIFSRYDVSISLDKKEIGTLTHGTTDTYQIMATAGKHSLRFEKNDDSSVNGTISLTVSGDTVAKYNIHCRHDEVEINELSVGSADPSEQSAATAEITATPTITATPMDAESLLESTFPKDNARRAIIVAMTNCFSDEVWTDGYYDSTKFFSYSDASASKMEVYQNGEWNAVNNNTWHVDGLIPRKIHDSDFYLKGEYTVCFDGSDYLIANAGSLEPPNPARQNHCSGF